MNYNPFKLEFTLKQHTPIIHFQHEQDGATLRATELKPKLDKYLIENLTGLIGKQAIDKFENGIQEYLDEKKTKRNRDFKKEWKLWTVAEGNIGHLALDYKLHIGSINSCKHKIGFPKKKKDNGFVWNEQFPSFFANMGEKSKEDPKLFSFYSGNINCVISSFNVSLILHLKSLKSVFEDFFLKNNFGTRQSKGFGSFTMVKFNENSLANSYQENVPFFTVKAKKADSFLKENRALLTKNDYLSESDQLWLFDNYNLFNGIEIFYKTLRSGINMPGRFYFKSLMFFYAKVEITPQQWDKKTMRLHFYRNHPAFMRIKELREDRNLIDTFNYTPSGTHEKDKLLFRDLLGLASEQEWSYYNDKLTKEVTTAENESIGRFKSPFTFKPIRQADESFKVYILAETIPSEYLNSNVVVKSKNTPQEEMNLNLKTPVKFSPLGYLKWAVKYYTDNVSEGENPFVEYSGDVPRELDIIDDIFFQLSESLK